MLIFLALACTTEPAPETPTVAEAPTPAPISVRLALNWVPEPEFGGFYEAQLSGGYAAAGFEVEIIPGGPGAPTLELLESGKAEAAITVADDLLLKRQRGLKAVAAWPALQTSPLGLLAHRSLGATSIAELGGLADVTVAIELGGPFHTFLWQRHGWDGKVDAVPYGGSVGPFLTDPQMVQQAYITSEPCVAKARGADAVFLDAREAGWNPYGVVLAFSDPPPAWAGDFVTATHAGWEAYLADPSRADAEIARLNPELDAALLACISETQRPFVTGTDGLGAMTEARWQETWDALVAIGQLPPEGSPTGAWRDLRAP